MNADLAECMICHDVFTSTHVEVEPGEFIFICSNCVDAAKDNFIWICLACGKVYIQPKKLVINKVKDLELKKNYMLCEDIQIIQGIDVCISCTPERVIDFMEMELSTIEC